MNALKTITTHTLDNGNLYFVKKTMGEDRMQCSFEGKRLSMAIIATAVKQINFTVLRFFSLPEQENPLSGKTHSMRNQGVILQGIPDVTCAKRKNQMVPCVTDAV